MQSFFNSLTAEFLKLKRSITLIIAVLMPLLAIIILSLMSLTSRRFASADQWQVLSERIILGNGYFFILILVVILTASLNTIDHQANSWKHLFTLPAPRWLQFISKTFVAYTLILLSWSVIYLGIPISGWLLKSISSALTFEGAIPWRENGKEIIYIFLSSFFMISVHNWLCWRMKNFSLPVLLGFVFVVLGLFILIYSNAPSFDKSIQENLNILQNFYPWVIHPPGYNETNWILYRIGGGVLVTILGCIHVHRKNVFN
ncbi:ABC transporter permease [candidate division KSB1 bacterium]